MIAVKNVSLCYRMPAERVSGLKEYIVASLQGKIKYKEFWALDDVSFQVRKGEVLGIIGHNGAGKSTLLKVISGILKPTRGSVEVKGNVVPMLELGSGFDFDLTGRENIFLNGAILGYSEEFLKEQFDEIVDFSELRDFIEAPLRNYSSGMVMRLAFSIATVVKPDILIVDEILAVGDADFQKKSQERMMELMSGGTTVLFVSHNIDQIKQLCCQAIWLEHGRIRLYDQVEIICKEYCKYNESIKRGNRNHD
jgi:ABC-type polysaccharide/polyol phosphate transport system ATPase subunit